MSDELSNHAGSPRTRCVRSGLETDAQHRAVVPPLHLSSNFTFPCVGEKPEYDYTRSGNPTRDLLVEALADLEGAAGGVVTSTGMAAITVALQGLPVGGTVVAPHDCYGGTYRLLRALERQGNVRLTLVDQTQIDRLNEALASGRPGESVLWIETPSNPLLRVTPLEPAIDLARRHGFKVVVDNTFLSPVWQRPLDWGADVVVHSTTKYLNGHSDVVGGVALAATRDGADELAWWGNCLGVTGAPFDSYMTLRGLRTLHVRLEAHERNAKAVVEVLSRHPAVERVYYPGLPDHSGHEIARIQQSGFGAMVSFDLALSNHSGDEPVSRFVSGLQHFSLAESLGGVESLVAHPATMTHAAMDVVARREAGIGDRLVRLSVGIENGSDLCRDIQSSLDRCDSYASPVAAAIDRPNLPETSPVDSADVF